jgi:hypothetical protein
MDWKIVGASMAAILLVSGLFVSSMEIGDFFSSIIGKLREWLGKSPFEGFFASPAQKVRPMSIYLTAPEITLQPESPVNITSPSTMFLNFQGRLEINFGEGKIAMIASDSPFEAGMPLGEYEVEGLHFTSVTFSSVGLEVDSHVKSENGSVEMSDFLGKARILPDSLLLEGNVSSLSVRMEDLEWELK